MDKVKQIEKETEELLKQLEIVKKQNLDLFIELQAIDEINKK